MRRAFEIACMAAIVTALGSAAMAVDIITVPVGNAGNAGDTEIMMWDGTTGYGAVAYEYRIGKYEVTAGQYRDFLNAVDPTGANTNNLYNANMDSDQYGCQITWNSSSSTYDFSGKPSGTAANWENRPVNFVSWYDAAMYANWATSGSINQGAYDTSTSANWGDSDASAYTGITAHDSDDMDALVSTYGKVYVIPTEDEWYKAAYHKNDGVTGNYYDYPTSSDTPPGYVNNSGNLSGTGNPFTEEGTDPGNYATYDDDGEPYTIGSPYYRTIVGEWENSDSPYGTFDQGGNVYEWNEVIIDDDYRSCRGMRGGSFSEVFGVGKSVGKSDAFSGLLSSYRCYNFAPTAEDYEVGFRVSEVPEPATMAILMLGGVGILRRRKCVRR